MSWYTDSNWWSAIGQWVGGLGTIGAALIAAKQIKKTRDLQYEIMKPEMILTGEYDGMWKVTAINIKPTPIVIKRIERQVFKKPSPDITANEQIILTYGESATGDLFTLKTGEYKEIRESIHEYLEQLREEGAFFLEFKFIDVLDTRYGIYALLLAEDLSNELEAWQKKVSYIWHIDVEQTILIDTDRDKLYKIFEEKVKEYKNKEKYSV